MGAVKMAPKRKPKDESAPPKPTDQELARLEAAKRGSGPGTSSGPDRGRGNGPARGKQASTFSLHTANGCEYLPTELKLPADLDWEEWQELFHSIISNSKSSAWWIGDALVFASKERNLGGQVSEV
jgi:hypothetical protein